MSSSSKLAAARRVDRRAIRALALCFLLVASVYVALPFLPTASGADPGESGVNPPRGIHLSYHDDPTTAVMTWYTRDPSTSRADWGFDPGPPFPNSAAGTDYTSPNGTFLHTVSLTGLVPGAVYHYRVGDADMSSQYRATSTQPLFFRAAPEKGSSETFTFAAAGDWGDTRATKATSNNIAAQGVNIAIPDGDLYYSDNETTIQNVTRKWQAFGKSAFVQTATGSNEHTSNGADTPTETVCAFANLPGNERTYAYTYGNTFFLTVDWGDSLGIQTDGVDGSGPSCGGEAGTAAIRAWMDAQLNAADLDSRIQWKVVYQHQFCYGISNTWQNNVALCPNELGLPDQMEDLLVKHNVDIVVQAHDHKYGRTYPVKFGTPVQTGSTYDNPGAPVYVLVGTGGSPNTDTCRTFDWIAACEAPNKTSGFGWFSVSPGSIEYRFYKNDMTNLANPPEVIDSFTLNKPVVTDFSVSLNPASGRLGKEESLQSTVTVRGVSSDPVSLSVSGCPESTVCELSPTSGELGFRSTLTVTASQETPSGNHSLTITASNGTFSNSTQFDLFVQTRQFLSFSKGDGGSFSETDDAYIDSGANMTNNGGDPELRVDGECSSAPFVCKTLIKFPSIIGPNPGQIPLGSVIVNASLELTVNDTGSPEDVSQLTEAWIESDVTWNGFAEPGFPANLGSEVTILPSSLGPLSIDLTTIVQRWADGWENQGILLASTGTGGVIYSSSEAAAGRPILQVEFFPPLSFDFSIAVSPLSGTVEPGGSINATVTATLVSQPAQPLTFSCANLPAGASCSFDPSAASPTGAANVSFAAAASTPDGTYAVSIQATDGITSRSTEFLLSVQSLVLSYDMETMAADGTMIDLSGFGRNGTLLGTSDVAGRVGRARYFNGGEKLTTPALFVPATDFTVAAWFNWTTNPSPSYSGIQGGGYSWELRVRNDGRFFVVFYQAIAPDIITAAVSPLAYNDGTWHHAAGVLRSGLAELYVDGVLVAQDTTNAVTSVRPSTQTVVGRVASDFVGAIDEIRTHTRALTAEEIAVLAPPPPPPPPPADGLVLSYDMEMLLPNGQMEDLSGQGNHGTLYGTTDVAGQVGRARSFNGAETITAPAITVPATDFTVAAWFNWTTNPSPSYSGIQGGGYSWELRVRADGRFAVVFYQAIGPDILTSATSPLAYADGTWHHVAGVLRSGLAELFVDGVLVAQDTTNPVTTVRPSTSTVVGYIASGFVGAIDEIRIFTRALTAEEIAVLAPPPPPPPPPTDGLILSYDMETLLLNGQMKDLSGQGNHGTLSGTTDVAGQVARARSFNSGEKITASAISVPATDFTVAAWFNWTTNPSPSYSGIQGGGYSWELRVRNDGRYAVVFYQAIGPDVLTSATSPLAYSDGTWHHAAGVLRNGLAELFVDGVLVAQDMTNPITSARPATQTVVGYVASGFVGAIDEIRIFTRALTAEEIAVLAPPPPPTPPPADGLVLSYDMETLLLIGQMKDLSGQGNHGTLVGTTDVAGEMGRARYFNGGDRIAAPALSVSELNFTVAAWFNWTTNPSPSYSGIQGGGYSWELRVRADGRFSIIFYQAIAPDVYTIAVSSLAYNDGTWHHAAGVLRSGLAELFVDGVLVAQDTTNPVTTVRPSTSTVIGYIASGFVGSIDEIRIFTRALTAEDIAALAPGSTLSVRDVLVDVYTGALSESSQLLSGPVVLAPVSRSIDAFGTAEEVARRVGLVQGLADASVLRCTELVAYDFAVG